MGADALLDIVLAGVALTTYGPFGILDMVTGVIDADEAATVTGKAIVTFELVTDPGIPVVGAVEVDVKGTTEIGGIPLVTGAI